MAQEWECDVFCILMLQVRQSLLPSCLLPDLGTSVPGSIQVLQRILPSSRPIVIIYASFTVGTVTHQAHRGHMEIILQVSSFPPMQARVGVGLAG